MLKLKNVASCTIGVVIFLCLLVQNQTFARSEKTKNTDLKRYYSLLDSASFDMRSHKYEEAIQQYNRVLKLHQIAISGDAYQGLFLTYMKMNNIDSAKINLVRFIVNQGGVEKDWFRYHVKDKFSLNLDSVNNLFHPQSEVVGAIVKFIDKDQLLRKKQSERLQRKEAFVMFDEPFMTQDSLNYIELKIYR